MLGIRTPRKILEPGTRRTESEGGEKVVNGITIGDPEQRCWLVAKTQQSVQYSAKACLFPSSQLPASWHKCGGCSSCTASSPPLSNEHRI
jgi:hypothetical protein